MVEKAPWVSGAWNDGTTSYLFWAGTELVQKRVGSSSTTHERRQLLRRPRRNPPLRHHNTSYYYTTDHLGSIREVTDSAKNVVAAYDYDPYGVRTRVYPAAPAASTSSPATPATSTTRTPACTSPSTAPTTQTRAGG